MKYNADIQMLKLAYFSTESETIATDKLQEAVTQNKWDITFM